MNMCCLICHLLLIIGSAAQEVIMDPMQPEQSKKNSLVKLFIKDNISSYAGYFDLKRKDNQSKLFFWFFPHSDPKTPFIVWLQGQPGLSSIYGLFEEHGPFDIDENTLAFLKRDYALTNAYHVLYLDHETNCGFSHELEEKEVFGSLKHIPKQLYYTLVQFFQIFNEYSENDIYLAGESSMNLIIPRLVQEINDDDRRFNIKGIMIGGGIFHEQNSIHYVNSLFRYGILSLKDKDMLQKDQHALNAYVRSGRQHEAIHLIGTLMVKVENIGFKSIYDIRDPNAVVESSLPPVINRDDIRREIHVGTRLFQNRTQYLVGDLLLPVYHLYSDILTRVKVLLYNGQFDAFSPYSYASLFIDSLRWPGLNEFYRMSRKNWVVDDKLLGYWKTAANLTHVFVRKAGHFVGKRQPKALYLMYKNFIEDKFD